MLSDHSFCSFFCFSNSLSTVFLSCSNILVKLSKRAFLSFSISFVNSSFLLILISVISLSNSVRFFCSSSSKYFLSFVKPSSRFISASLTFWSLLRICSDCFSIDLRLPKYSLSLFSILLTFLSNNFFCWSNSFCFSPKLFFSVSIFLLCSFKSDFSFSIDSILLLCSLSLFFNSSICLSFSIRILSVSISLTRSTSVFLSACFI